MKGHEEAAVAVEAKPGGRFYGWWLLVVLWVSFAVVSGFISYGAPILFPRMVQEFGWARTALSLGLTSYYLLVSLASPVVAWATNRFGGRQTLFIGSMLICIGTFLLQFSDSITTYFIFYSVLVGLGMAFATTIPLSTIITFWFKRHRGKAIGLVMAGGAVGGLIAAPTLGLVLQYTEGGWRTGWLTISAVVFAAGLISVVFVRNKPEELGQYPDGINPQDAVAEVADSKNKVHQTAEDWTLAEVLRTRQFWFLTLGTICIAFLWRVLVTHGPLHLMDRGFTPAQTATIFGLGAGLSVVGRLGAGFLSDRIEARTIFLAAIVFGMIGGVLFWFVSPDNLLTLSYPIFGGICYGISIVIKPIIIGNYWGTKAYAAILGIIIPIMTGATAIAPLLAGAAYDRNGNYFWAMVVCFLILVVGFIAMLLITPPERTLKRSL